MEKMIPETRRLIVSTLLLVGFGVLIRFMAFSFHAGYLPDQLDQFNSYFLGHTLPALLSLILMVMAVSVPVAWWTKYRRQILLISIQLLLVSVWLAPQATELSQFAQLTQFAQFALVVWLSGVLTRPDVQLKNYHRGLLPRLIIVALVLLLVALGSDLSTLIVFGGISLVLLYLGGTRLPHLVGILLVGMVSMAATLAIYPDLWCRITLPLGRSHHTTGTRGSGLRSEYVTSEPDIHFLTIPLPESPASRLPSNGGEQQKTLFDP